MQNYWEKDFVKKNYKIDEVFFRKVHVKLILVILLVEPIS